MFKIIEHRWNTLAHDKHSSLYKVVPNLSSLSEIKLSKIAETSKVVEIKFDNLSSVIQDGSHIATLKRCIFDFIKSFAMAKIKPSTNDDFVLVVSKNMNDALSSPVRESNNKLISSMSILESMPITTFKTIKEKKIKVSEAKPLLASIIHRISDDL